jgi:hypothetical protein
MIKEHEQVVLSTDVPEEGLKTGDVGTVVHLHKKGEALEVEFATVAGETVTIVTLLTSQVRSVSRREIVHARRLVKV